LRRRDNRSLAQSRRGEHGGSGARAEEKRGAEELGHGLRGAPERAVSVDVDHRRAPDRAAAEEHGDPCGCGGQRGENREDGFERSVRKLASEQRGDAGESGRAGGGSQHAEDEDLAAHPRSAQAEEKPPGSERTAEMEHADGEAGIERHETGQRKDGLDRRIFRCESEGEEEADGHLREREHEHERPVGVLKAQRVGITGMGIGGHRTLRGKACRWLGITGIESAGNHLPAGLRGSRDACPVDDPDTDRARGQACTQAGASPTARRLEHMSHLRTMPRFSEYFGTS